ncbi:MAG: hypothetical protein AB7O26_06860, partial [Planctomycetaceae bacterium]
SFEPSMALQFDCSGVVEGPGSPGSFRVESRMGPTSGEPQTVSAETLKLIAKATAIRLDEWQPVVSRLFPDARCTGTIDGEFELDGAMNENGIPTKITCGGRLVSAEVNVSTSRDSVDNPTSIRDLALGGRIEYQPDRLTVDDVRLKSNLARAAFKGSFDMSPLRLESTSEPGDSNAEIVTKILRSGRGRAEASVDIARVASLFPEIVQLREGVELTGGTLQASLDSSEKEGRRTWKGSFEAKGLAAIENGRSVTWENLFSLNVSAHEAADGPVLDAIDCQSEFLTATGRGSWNDATVKVTCDLDRLSKELSRFVDVETSRLAGMVKFDATCQKRDGDRLEASARGSVENFEFAIPGKRLWSEERFDAELSAIAKLNANQIAGIETASILLRSGADRLETKLLQPTSISSTEAELAVNVQFIGDLARWKSRAAPWVELDDWDIQGRTEITGRVFLGGESLRWEELLVKSEKFRAWGHGLFISEPTIRVQTAGTWNRRTGELTISKTTWASQAMSLKAEKIGISRNDSGIGTISGNVVFRGGVDSLSAWTRDPNQQPNQKLTGIVSGSVRVEKSGEVTESAGTIQFDGMAMSTLSKTASGAVWSEAWRENRLVLACRARYGHDVDTLELEKCEVTSESLKFAMRGAVGGLTGKPSADISGEIEYDWKNLTARLKPWLGDDFQFTGAQKNQFAVRGPRQIASVRNGSTASSTQMAISTVTSESTDADSTEPTSLSAEAGFGWQTARIYGLDVGAADVKAQFNGSALEISPLDLAVGEGRLKLAPQVQLYGDSPLLTLPAGRTIDNVKLSPEVCRGWLKYVAPLLADATHAEGRLSLDLSGAEFPITDPGSGQAGGTVLVHQASISPGTSMKQLLQVAEQVRQLMKRSSNWSQLTSQNSWVKMPSQNVEFQFVDRRFHHKLIEFHFGDIVIRTEGSVGLDETLALTATIPVADDWIQKERALAGMKGQAIRIPISGTLDRPQIDPNVVRNLARQIGGSAASSLIQDNVRNQVERLFKSR